MIKAHHCGRINLRRCDTDDHRRLISSVAEQASAVINNSILFDQAQEDSVGFTEDPLRQPAAPVEEDFVEIGPLHVLTTSERALQVLFVKGGDKGWVAKSLIKSLPDPPIFYGTTPFTLQVKKWVQEKNHWPLAGDTQSQEEEEDATEPF